MKRTISELAACAGVSVRTLHYYDEIGLLPPSEATAAGYRLYDDAALERLMQVLFFRELDFPLREIRDILDNPSFDRRQALEKHRELLLMKRERLDGLIRLADNTLKGENTMELHAFDASAIDEARRQYADEARSRWGGTDAYRESEAKTAGYRKDDWVRVQESADAVLGRLAGCRGCEPGDAAVQSVVADWQAHITAHFYTCTKEILASLGEMYVADERFTRSLDGRYGEDTAALLRDAIRIYCG